MADFVKPISPEERAAMSFSADLGAVQSNTRQALIDTGHNARALESVSANTQQIIDTVREGGVSGTERLQAQTAINQLRQTAKAAGAMAQATEVAGQAGRFALHELQFGGKHRATSERDAQIQDAKADNATLHDAAVGLTGRAIKANALADELQKILDGAPKAGVVDEVFDWLAS